MRRLAAAYGPNLPRATKGGVTHAVRQCRQAKAIPSRALQVCPRVELACGHYSEPPHNIGADEAATVVLLGHHDDMLGCL